MSLFIADYRGYRYLQGGSIDDWRGKSRCECVSGIGWQLSGGGEKAADSSNAPEGKTKAAAGKETAKGRGKKDKAPEKDQSVWIVS